MTISDVYEKFIDNVLHLPDHIIKLYLKTITEKQYHAESIFEQYPFIELIRSILNFIVLRNISLLVKKLFENPLNLMVVHLQNDNVRKSVKQFLNEIETVSSAIDDLKIHEFLKRKIVMLSIFNYFISFLDICKNIDVFSDDISNQIKNINQRMFGVIESNIQFPETAHDIFEQNLMTKLNELYQYISSNKNNNSNDVNNMTFFDILLKTGYITKIALIIAIMLIKDE